MKLHDGTILMHAGRPYDPVKAHEYYIRTRQLKGRKKGSPTYTVQYKGKAIKLSAKQLAAQRAYAAERVNSIKKRLNELASKLREQRSEARQKDAKAKREAKKGPTVAEKSEAARESKKYREKHKQELATKSRQSGSSGSKGSTKKTKSESASLEDRISIVRDLLTAAVERQRALASATRNS